jgi:choline dehydrogenase-like flavoprotein
VIIDLPRDAYDVVVVGSGFGSLFAAEAYLQRFPAHRMLIIERGRHNSRTWQLAEGRNSDRDPADFHRLRPGEKSWNYTIGFGGGLNCWWAQTPRFHPTDFRTRSDYGRSIDWPLSYDDLEPWYLAAEQRMLIAGDDAIGRVLPRSGPYPQPAHRLSTVDEIMQAAQPEDHFALPTARASVATENRGQCCAASRCNLCPVNAKFTTDNAFADLLDAPDVDIVLEANVRSILHAGGVVEGIRYAKAGREGEVRADLVVLGANAIQSPAILLRSGVNDAWVGRGLHEQHSVGFEAYLNGLDAFDGGTVTTGLNYGLYDGPFRTEAAGALVYFENRWSYGLRPEPGRWRQTLPLWVSLEDEPQWANRVTLEDDEPLVEHADVSEYAHAGAARISETLPGLLAPLPVEELHDRGVVPTASHVQGTLRMGTSVEDSVVDAGLLHHRLRNLLIVGSAVLPTSSAANPSLTVAALSLRAVNQL